SGGDSGGAPRRGGRGGPERASPPPRAPTAARPGRGSHHQPAGEAPRAFSRRDLLEVLPEALDVRAHHDPALALPADRGRLPDLAPAGAAPPRESGGHRRPKSLLRKPPDSVAYG